MKGIGDGLGWAVCVALAVTCLASCAREPSPEIEELQQAVAELRAEVSILQRTVERLEHESAETREALAASTSSRPAENLSKPRCEGHTADGSRCRRAASAGGRFCWQHEDPQGLEP